MALECYIVDAFAARAFEGNPAAVVPLPDFLPDAVMQAMAAEHNLSETAFVVRDHAGWRLRWFTPTTEVEMCGHATLATAFVLAEVLGLSPPFTFHTLSGPLGVLRDGARFVLDFPAMVPVRAVPPPGLAAALGVAPLEVWKARDWLAVLPDAAAVRALRPDHAAIAALPDGGVAPDGQALPAPGPARVIVTAAGDAGFDCTSRYFAIKAGVAEDPVTGTAHTQIVPFWAARLGRDALVCRQASARGGTLWCEARGERVWMGGTAVLYARMQVLLPA